MLSALLSHNNMTQHVMVLLTQEWVGPFLKHLLNYYFLLFFLFFKFIFNIKTLKWSKNIN